MMHLLFFQQNKTVVSLLLLIALGYMFFRVSHDSFNFLSGSFGQVIQEVSAVILLQFIIIFYYILFFMLLFLQLNELNP